MNQHEWFRLIFWVSIIVLALILPIAYYRIQSNFNSALFSVDTPYIFNSHALEDDAFCYYKAIGAGVAKQSKVVICGLMRDNESNIPFIKNRSKYIIDSFSDYIILIVENDSKDNTRLKLLEWAKEDPKVIILGCGYNESKCNLQLPRTQGHLIDGSRMDKMTFLRETYLNEIKTYFPNYEFTIMWDMDCVSYIYRDGILNSIGYMSENNWDCVCANGFYHTPVVDFYYDDFAHLDKDERVKEHNRGNLWHDMFSHYREYIFGDPPSKCRSCFSGFAIYRTNSILNTSYYTRPTDCSKNNIICEHVCLNTQLPNVYLNPSMLNVLLRNPK